MSTTDTETVAMVLEQTGRLLDQHAPIGRHSDIDETAWQPDLWTALDEAGLPLALVAETHGGIGLSLSGAMKVIRLTAGAAVPLPIAETMVAGMLWTDLGGALPGGPLTLALPATPATLAKGRLDTPLLRVPWAGQAHILTAARADGNSVLALLAPVPEAPLLPNMAGEARTDVNPAAQQVVATVPCADASETLLELAAMLRAHQIVGAIETCLAMTVSYVAQRKQFGRPLGKFQAVQQMLAEAAGEVAAASAAADQASEADAGADRSFAVAVAKARCGEAGSTVAALTHQCHGAIGFTREYPLHAYTRRVWSWREEFGSETFWQDRLGRLVCAKGGEQLWPLVLREIA